MKKRLLIILFSAITFLAHGQQGGLYNAVKREGVKIAGIKDQSGFDTLPDTDKSTVITYRDGLGRTIAVSNVQASPFRQDIVSFTSYGEVGNVQRYHLPYAANSTTGGILPVDQLIAAQTTFYANNNDQVVNDPYPYSENIHEPSPDNFLLERGAPGQDWQPGHHTERYTVRANDANEFRIWTTDLTSPGYYAAASLMITEVIDENGNRTLQVTDKSGKIIQQKEQVNSTDWLTTLFIYYANGQLAYTVQPEGVKQLGSGTTLTPALIANFGFEYHYNTFGQVIEKKAAGKDVEYFVYDPLGRLVLSQDALLRASHTWNYIKYDRHNRIVINGLYTNSSQVTRSAVQQMIDTLSYSTGEKYFEQRNLADTHGYTNRSFPTTSTEVLTVNYYDNDRDLDNNGSPDFTYTGQGLAGEHSSGRLFGAMSATKVKILNSSDWLIGYSFFDTEGRVIQLRSNNHRNMQAEDVMTFVYNSQGMLALQKKDHQVAGQPLLTVTNRYAYDHTGRPLQIWQKNNAGIETLVVAYRYNELGQLIAKNLHCETCDGSDEYSQGDSLYADEIVRTAYLAAERNLIARNRVLLKAGYQVSGGDLLHAQINIQQVENAHGKGFLQSIDYRYNIRGWLTHINNSSLEADGENNEEAPDFFGMQLLYQAQETGLGNAAQFNGNISGMVWKGPGDEQGDTGRQGYTFAYDKANRLLTAGFGVKAGSAWTGESGALNESITYDDNGNIKSLQRTSRKPEWIGVLPEYTAETIDNLTYTFAGNTNKLTKVEDAVTGDAGKAGFVNGSTETTEYAYNENGDMVSDKNKGISRIRYNVLNKPDTVLFTNGTKITYRYDAAGTRLTQQLWHADTLMTRTDYVGGFVYTNDTLSFFASPEGRVVNKHGVLEHEYALTDHQGNTRVMFTAATPATEIFIADFESAANSNFENYSNRIDFELMDHTDFSGPAYSYSQKLTGGNGSQVGVAKAFKVYPGDKVQINAYAKYYSPTGTLSNLTGFAAALTSAFGLTSGSTGEALKAYGALENYGGFIASGGGEGEEELPKVFVTILLFDKDHNFLMANWDQVDGGQQTGATPKAEHDLLRAEVMVKEAGYAYVFVSNESPTLVEFYVDDVTVTYLPTRVLQYAEYYPFGLQTSKSWTREGHENNHLYNEASELNAAAGWYETMFRNYDPALGRFLQHDPLAELATNITPYRYGFNSPLNYNDPTGAYEYSSSGYDLDWKKYRDNVGLSGYFNTGGSQMSWYASGTGDNAGSGSVGDFVTVALLGNGGHWENGRATYYDEGDVEVVESYRFQLYSETVLKIRGEYIGYSEGRGLDENGNITDVEYYATEHIEPYKDGWVRATVFKSVGQPGLLESAIPIWGSGRAAIDDFQNGRWGWGLFNTAMAISDVFLVKTLATAGAKLLIKSTVKEASTVAAKGGSNLVYQGFDKAGVVRYVGITEREAAVRFGEHLSSGTAKSLLQYRVVDGATGLTRTQARVWEQTLINQYGLQKNGGLLLNKINSIAPKNWWQYGIK